LRLGVHLSSSKVFYLEPLVFRSVSFFLGGLCFEPTNESCNNVPSFVTLAYQAYQLLSNIELMVIAILMMVKRVRAVSEVLRFDHRSIFNKACARRSVKIY
jgi:hypothetical protein